MSTRRALTDKSLSFVTLSSSGAVTVDIERYLKSPAGKSEMKKIKQVSEAIRSNPRPTAGKRSAG